MRTKNRGGIMLPSDILFMEIIVTAGGLIGILALLAHIAKALKTDEVS